ncbi:hypothetical protein ACIQ7D_10935 [Streptomyces sp. NPDC096310]|uniref:hypothetical protein n=1 Tax=Streptomyces sp. NPDC096310 TaxID=3366082 RepID=UPI003807A2E8
MDLEKQPAYAHRRTDGPGAGCLTVAVRIPVRVVVLLVVLPVRLVWDAVPATARALDRIALRPLGRACAWLYASVLTPVARGLAVAVGRLATAVWQWVVVPVVRYGVVVSAVWIHTYLLTPLGHGIRLLYETLLTPLGRALLVWPWAALWRYVVVPVVTYGLARPAVWAYRHLLTPLGHGSAWLLTALGRGAAATGRALIAALVWLLLLLVVTPVSWVYRRVLVPVGREAGAALAVAWRVAGYLSRAVWRALGLLAWQLVGRPVRWTYRRLCTPLGHWVRDRVWAPARTAAVAAGRGARDALRWTARGARDALRWTAETVRRARRDVWGALTGVRGGPWPVEPPEHRARTLGSTTIVPGAAPAPETSPHTAGPVRDPG